MVRPFPGSSSDALPCPDSAASSGLVGAMVPPGEYDAYAWEEVTFGQWFEAA